MSPFLFALNLVILSPVNYWFYPGFIMEEEEKKQEYPDTGENNNQPFKTTQLSGMYEDWFLDYASYVILERAVPALEDGLKPVQRRILHSMFRLDDGRYNKVANIIGHTMQFHPHGDTSIGDALVQLGQKDLLIDMQGNWGNILTGDSAAASRYIEARLSKFALEVVFNPKTTEWKSSYDGRNKEPVALPVKFPLLLAQGVEGIAVGLASKLLPHNFLELIDASIKILKGEDFEIFPDFSTGGMADCSRYNDGLRGGKVRVRAKINKTDKKTLTITEIPFGTTTGSLIDSVLSANDKGKIRVKKIDDNTAESVEIVIHLHNNVSPDQTIDALYAFTDCEISISPNSCIIQGKKPLFLGVKDILKSDTQNTLGLLKSELEIQKAELLEKLHLSSLEKIFIEKEIYLDIRKTNSFEEMLETIDKGLKPYVEHFIRDVVRDDLIRLSDIPIKRISRYNTFKAEEYMRGLEEELKEVENHLAHLIDYAINYFRQIKKKYGAGRERKTELRNFDTIEAAAVAVNNAKLYINREEGFAGTSLKKDEFVCDCSDIDDFIVFNNDGTFMVTKVATKVYIGSNVIHIDIFRKNDERTVYNMVYQDGRIGNVYIKRFSVIGVTRDKVYDLTIGTKGTRVLYFTANPNGEAEVLKVYLRPKPKLRKLNFDFDFSDLAIKNRNAKGNILSRHAVRKIQKKEDGVSTLGALKIWYDDTVHRLSTEERGIFLGEFRKDDKIFTINKSGIYKFYSYDLATHFDDDMMIIEKFNPKKIITALYMEGESGFVYIKRFQPDGNGKPVTFITEHPKSKLLLTTDEYLPVLKVVFDPKKNDEDLEDEEIMVADFIDVKGEKAKGKRLTKYVVKNLIWQDPLPYEEEEEEMLESEEESNNSSEREDPSGDDDDPIGEQMSFGF